ncbi:MAG: hypothetical protein V4561_04100 [Bacteroidota bacterium]
MNKTIKWIQLTAIAFMIIPLSLASCNKDSSCGVFPDECYNESLYKNHKDDVCTTDCPGIYGCDGKRYCNECEANRKGISVKKN